MAYLIPNQFSSYHLTEEEELQGQILTITQQQVIQNLLAVTAEEKNLLSFDTTNPLEYAQREAGLAGQLAAYAFILESSEAASRLLNDPNYTDPTIEE